MTTSLICGFCTRPWEECQADCCSERKTVIYIAKLLGYKLTAEEEAEIQTWQ